MKALRTEGLRVMDYVREPSGSQAVPVDDSLPRLAVERTAAEGRHALVDIFRATPGADPDGGPLATELMPRTRCVAYTRVSTREQADSELSMKTQTEAIQKFAADRGYEIVTIFEEEGVSGLDEHRKEFKRMLEFSSAPGANIDAVLVYEMSRFGRDAALAGATTTALRRQGVEVIAICQEGSDEPMVDILHDVATETDPVPREVRATEATDATELLSVPPGGDASAQETGGAR